MVLVAAGLGACGDGATKGPADAGGRPLLPAGAAGATGEAMSLPAAGTAEGGDARSMIAPVRPTEYRLAEGAEAPAATAPAYRLAPGKGASTAQIARALGVADETEVDVEDGVAWYYSRQPTGSVSSDVTCAPEEDCAPVPASPAPPPGLPSAAEAEARWRQILGALGVDTDQGTFEAEPELAPLRQVVFRHTVGGLVVSNLDSAIAFGENGRVEFANGLLATFEKLGDYPLVDLEEALERFKEGSGGVEAMTAADASAPAAAPAATAKGDGGASQAEPGPPGHEPTMTVEPQPATPTVPLEPEIVEITRASLVLTVVVEQGCERGAFFVVPAFDFMIDEAAGSTVPAVAGASLVAPDAAGSDDPCPDVSNSEDPVGKPEPAPVPPAAP